MRYVLTLMSLLILAASPSKAQCPCEGGCLCRDCDCGFTYDQAYTKAVHEGRPLVVYVKQRPAPVPGCCVCRHDGFPGQTVPGVVLALPDDVGGMDRVGQRDSYPTPAWISQRVGELIGEKQKRQARERAERQKIAVTPRPYFQPPSFGYAPMRGGCSSGG